MAAKAGRLTGRTVRALEDLGDMWAALDKCRATVASERPANGFTLNEYCKRYRVAESTAMSRINKLVRAGGLFKTPCRLLGIDGKFRVTNVFTLVA